MQSSFNPYRDLFEMIKFLPGIVLALLSTALRFKALQQTTFANGWDGYFYLVQLKSWIEEGSMHSVDRSLIYPLMRAVHWFSGDYILTYKLTGALLAGLATYAIFYVAKQWTSNIYIAVLIACISLFSPHLTYFVAQFPKNLLGFVLLLFFIGSLESKSKYQPIGWMILGFFGHRLTFGLTLIFGLGWGVFKHFSIKKIGIVLASVLVLFALSFLIPGVLNWSDLQRFEGLLTLDVQLAPYSFIQTFGTNDRITPIWMGEIILAAAIYLISMPFVFQAKKKWLTITLISVSTLLLFPFYKWNLTGMAYRFFLLYVLIAPLFLPLLLKVEKTKTSKITLLFIALLFMIGSIFSWRNYQPLKHDANYKKYAQLTSTASQYLQPGNTKLVIAHNALAEYFTFTTGIDCMPWNPEYDIPKDQLWRIATDIRQSEMGFYLKDSEMEKVRKIGVRYFLLPEYLWQKMLEKAKSEGDDQLLKKLETWRNPHKIRPGFLLKKK